MINTNNCSNILCISNKYDTINAEVNIPNKNKESKYSTKYKIFIIIIFN